MTIREFLGSAGFLNHSNATKAICPFHADKNPSAAIHDNDNTLYCYACHRLYTPRDFLVKYGVRIDEISDVQQVSLASQFEWGEPLFFA